MTSAMTSEMTMVALKEAQQMHRAADILSPSAPERRGERGSCESTAEGEENATRSV